ncbi:MAG: hypothetical protein DMF49_03340 [Acidobacteria bacterium]|nr:MAG: hypothetical protein DMF49_03340 [Acidobacteriota bacterium]
MSKTKAPTEGTLIDEDLHADRLKSGIVPQDTRVYLRVVRGPDKDRAFDLSSGGCYIIGRQAGDIPLSDTKVSHRHAEIKILGPEAHFIIDLASTNGTFLNGARVERRKIVHGDELRLGDTVMRFSVLEGTVPLSPV